MKNLETLFQQTIDDNLLTRSERKELKALLEQEGLDDREIGVLRSKVFDIAKAKLSSAEDTQIVEWLYNAIKVLHPVNQSGGSTGGRSEVFFSPGLDCLNAISASLSRAVKKVDICVFTISDNRISSEILQCHRKGVRVRILTDNDKLLDKGSDIDELARAGIPIRVDRTSNHMHHKFAVIDDAHVLTGSYNWTRSAAMYNQENLLVSHNPDSVKKFTREFQSLWDKMEPYS